MCICEPGLLFSSDSDIRIYELGDKKTIPLNPGDLIDGTQKRV